MGHCHFHPVKGRDEARRVLDNPYPCRFDMGLVKGMAQRFAPEATLTHDTSAGCRQKGANSCTYLIHW